MIVAVPVTRDGRVDPRWGRADRVAVAEVRDGAVTGWDVHDVGWSRLRDQGSDQRQHARVARFLGEHRVQVVVVRHIGDGMSSMLRTMGVDVRLGAAGDARDAVVALA